MLRTRYLPLAMAIGIALSGSTVVSAQQANGPLELFAGHYSKRLCQVASAERCINHIWKDLDRDRDTYLSLAEIERFLDYVKRWNKTTTRGIDDRTVVKMGLFVVNAIGVERLFNGYDTDDDGLLSRDEAFADFYMDDRPLAEILLDQNAVNEVALRRRFGRLAAPIVQLGQAASARVMGRGSPSEIDVTAVDQAEKPKEALESAEPEG